MDQIHKSLTQELLKEGFFFSKSFSMTNMKFEINETVKYCRHKGQQQPRTV